MPATAQLDSFTQTDLGRVRENNEDAAGSYEPADLEVRRERGCLYVVADGMSGHAAGEVASDYAVKKTLHEYYRLPWEGVEATLTAAIQIANRDIHDEGVNSLDRRGMGSTLVVAAIFEDRAVIANVGDSRAYLLRDGSLYQLTRDHSWVAERVAEGTLTQEEAADHPNRSMLTRNLGNVDTVQPDIFPVQPLARGDRVLLCSDGLWGPLPENQIASLAGRGDAVEGVMNLVAAANAAGGPDNVGVALVLVGGGGATTRRVRIGPLTFPRHRDRLPAILFGLAIALLIVAIGLLAFTEIRTPPVQTVRTGTLARPTQPPSTAESGSAAPQPNPADLSGAQPSVPATQNPSIPSLANCIAPNQPAPPDKILHTMRKAEYFSNLFQACGIPAEQQQKFYDCLVTMNGRSNQDDPPGEGEPLYAPATWPPAEGVCDHRVASSQNPSPPLPRPIPSRTGVGQPVPRPRPPQP